MSIRRGVHGDGMAYFGEHCITCPLRGECTGAAGGRTISVGVFEAALARAGKRQANPGWQADYRANRPKVERKLAHLMRRRTAGDAHVSGAGQRSTPAVGHGAGA